MCAAASRRSNSTSVTTWRPTCRSATSRRWIRARRSGARWYSRAPCAACAVHSRHRAVHRAYPLLFSRQHAAQVDLASMVIRAGRPLVLHAHGGYFDQFHRGLPALLRRTVDSILQRANVLIALSPRWRDFYVNECELSSSHVAVLPNPVRWTPEVPTRTGRSHVQFLFLGRMCQAKGTYDLMNAFAALPDAVRARTRLVLAGDGDLEAIGKLAAPFGEQVRVCRGSTARTANVCWRRAMCSYCRHTTKECRCRCSKPWRRGFRSSSLRWEEFLTCCVMGWKV